MQAEFRIRRPRRIGFARKERFTVEIPLKWTDISRDRRPEVLKAIKAMVSGESHGLFAAATGVSEETLAWVSLRDIDRLQGHLSWLDLTTSTTIAAISEFQHKLATYYAPSDNFIHGTCLEYVLMSEYYQAMTNPDDDGRAGYMLLATLYRRAGHMYREDARYPLENRERVEIEAAQLEGCDPIYILQAARYAEGIQKLIYDTYRSLFQDPKSSEEDKKPEKATLNFGWWGVYMDLAEEGVFGKLQDVYMTPFHTVCQYLLRRQINAKASAKKDDDYDV